MSIDPFAPDNQDATPTTTVSTESKETRPMQDSTTNSEVVATFKGGAGHEAPWVVIHADSLQEAAEVISHEEDLKQLFDNVKKASSYFNGGTAQAAKPMPVAATPSPTQAAVATPPGYVLKSGVTKSGRNAGKTWTAFMGADRNANLPAIWLSNGAPEGAKNQATYDAAMGE